ncbi:MAG: hypothetical protein EOP08_05720 [Proteobacteria bacterium]|nr:MAG: hypothetical protein EOP08_05720 [Pseudomonadota bacterium]
MPKILTTSGAIDTEAYGRLAGSLGRAEGIAFRYGPDASCVQAGPPRAPLAWAAPHKLCGNENGGWGEAYTYEVGGTCNDDLSYGSTQGPVLFDADALENDGVDWLQYMSFAHYVMQYRPAPSWTWGGRAKAPFFVEEAAQKEHGGPFSQPIAVGRSVGNQGSESDAGAVIGFADGALRCLGTNTGVCDFAAQLPPGKVPVALATTSDSEFLLVLAWDTASRTSELAVFAMTSQPYMITPTGGVFPGFQQGGAFHTGKLLGLVALPEVNVPTLLAANSTHGGGSWWHDVAGTQIDNWQMDISVEENRQTLLPGGTNHRKHGLSGLAVVGSKYEKKLVFVDLQPLFDFYNSHYFGARADFDATQSNAGPGPEQWPPTFEAAPASRPVVVSTLSTDDLVTAVYAGFRDEDRSAIAPLEAAVATMNGRLNRYAVGGLLDDTPAVAADVRFLDSIEVGRNVTSIVQSKHGAIFEAALTDVVMASRGDREIEFVSYAGGAGQVTKRISEGRMTDPISVYDSTRSKYVLTIADYTGRRVLSYRYGPFVYDGQQGSTEPVGPGPDGNDELDFGGSWATAGRPFAVTGTNVQ